MKIEAIPTEYNGITFRSRTEARWALFMDQLGVRYTYEMEAFNLGWCWYTPDFFLPDMPAFIEVKGEAPSEREMAKARALAIQSMRKVYILISDFNVPELGVSDAGWWAFIPTGCNGIYAADDDTGYLWTECFTCGKIGIEFQGRADRLGCDCPKSIDGDRGCNFDSPRLVDAYAEARGFCFQFNK